MAFLLFESMASILSFEGSLGVSKGLCNSPLH